MRTEHAARNTEANWTRLQKPVRCMACGCPMQADTMAVSDGEYEYCGEGCHSIRITAEEIQNGTRKKGFAYSLTRSLKRTRSGGFPKPSTIYETPLPAFARRNAH